MNETIVQAILGYLESSEPPGIDWPRHWFEEVCFSRWAAEELVNLILDHPLVPAEDTIDEFAVKMTAYAKRQAVSFLSRRPLPGSVWRTSRTDIL